MTADQPAAAKAPDITTLSLGWGVQSWTIAAMAALGELPKPDAAIHSDTTFERQATYAFARKWTPWLAERGVTVITVTNKTRTATVATGKTDIPAFTVGSSERGGQLRRQCTGEWKITPMRRLIRDMLAARGLKKRAGAVVTWLGISMDEIQRIKDSDVRYIKNGYPLIDRRMTRGDCINWLIARGLEVPPKSACVFCPFQSRESWRRLKRAGGPDWELAVDVDQKIRGARRTEGAPFDLYVHPARVPLPQAADDGGQLVFPLAEDECAGVCFV